MSTPHIDGHDVASATAKTVAWGVLASLAAFALAMLPWTNVALDDATMVVGIAADKVFAVPADRDAGSAAPCAR